MTDRRWWVMPLTLALVLLGIAAFVTLRPSADAAMEEVTPKDSLEAYGWDELSAIAREVAVCDSEEEATRVATRYGLCEEDGSLATAGTKRIEVAGAGEVRVALAGIWHDERSDGGKAGLSFVLMDAVGPHAMNHAFEDTQGDAADATGGWTASDMRAWLEDDLLTDLPQDLRTRIVRVQKRTASYVGTMQEADDVGALAGSAADWVGETSDVLWLLSAAELCGNVPAQEDFGIDQSMCDTYDAEGAQYRLFADAGIAPFVPSDTLVRSLPGCEEACTWWLRTKTLEFDEGFWLVGTDGTLLNGFGEDVRVVDDLEYAPDVLWGPDHARGVIVGFCL